MPPKARQFQGAVGAPALSIENVARRQVIGSAALQGRPLADAPQTKLFADAVPSLAGLQQQDVAAKQVRNAIQQRGMTSTGVMGIAAEPLGAVKRKRMQIMPTQEQAVEADVEDATNALLGVETKAPDGSALAEADLDNGSKTVLTVVMLGAVLSILLVAL